MDRAAPPNPSTHENEQVRVSGVLLHSFANACINLELLLGPEFSRAAADIAPDAWIPLSAFRDLLAIVSQRYVEPAPILERVGAEMMRAWYTHGPGHQLIKSGADFLRFQAGSDGYRSVIQGSDAQVGSFTLLSLDEAEGRALVHSTTVFQRDMERGVLRGGIRLAGDIAYVEIDNSRDPDRFEIQFVRAESSAAELPTLEDPRAASAGTLRTLLWQLRDGREQGTRDRRFWHATNKTLARALDDIRAKDSAISSSEQQFRSVTMTAQDAIVIVDDGGLVTFWNNGAEATFGYTAEEIIGRPLTLIIPPRYHAAHNAGMERVLRSGVSRLSGTNLELQGVRADGEEFPLELSFAYWQMDGRLFFSGIMRDITDRKRAEDRLRSFMSTLEQKNAELARKNLELERSRNELLRQYRRAEKMFSAFAEVLPGSVLDGKYEVGERLGAGGFGVVFRGRHTFLDRDVAIKIFHSSNEFGEETMARFRREAVSTCRVSHPNAISVLDSGVSGGGVPYLVLELLSGGTIKEVLAAGRTLSVADVVHLLQPVCAVLATAHAAGVVHRDIKPDNVFLHEEDGAIVVKVLDFGIAKLLERDDDEPVKLATQTGALIGTPVYISPERIQGQPYDGRADIYSVGIMAYELLAGRLPFPNQGGAPWEAVLARVAVDPTPLREHAPHVPEALHELVMASIARDPTQRPRADTLEVALRRLAREATGDADLRAAWSALQARALAGFVEDPTLAIDTTSPTGIAGLTGEQDDA